MSLQTTRAFCVFRPPPFFFSRPSLALQWQRCCFLVHATHHLWTSLWKKLAQRRTCPQKDRLLAGYALCTTAEKGLGAQCLEQRKFLLKNRKRELSTDFAKSYYYYYLNREYIEDKQQRQRPMQCVRLIFFKLHKKKARNWLSAQPWHLQPEPVF